MDAFYRATLRRERGIATAICPSVRPSACDVEVSWSHRLEYFENNVMANWPRLSSLCRPQHHGSNPMETPQPKYCLEYGWGIQCESKKNLQFSDIFPKRLGIFNQYFTHLLYVHIYARLQMFIQLSPTLTK